MENENSASIEQNKYSFLTAKKAKDVFAKIDYYLRSGMHIQREHPLPGELFRFIETDTHFLELKAYYKDFFQVVLCSGGQEWERYYYIDFEEGSRGNITSDYRTYLKTEYIIIGMLFFKVYKLDANIELGKVSDFTNLLFSEYEEEKNSLRKLISDAMGDTSSDLNDKKVEEIIIKAFSEFAQLGWVCWADDKKDSFKYMPSFERLRSMYQSQILGIDQLIKEGGNGR